MGKRGQPELSHFSKEPQSGRTLVSSRERNYGFIRKHLILKSQKQQGHDGPVSSRAVRSQFATAQVRAVTGFVNSDEDDLTHLKRLALFFDHISCVAPYLTIVKEELVPELRAEWAQGKQCQINFPAETRRAVWLPLRTLGTQAADLVLEFEDAGILTEIHEDPDVEKDPLFDELRKLLLGFDVLDDEFLKLSGTPVPAHKGYFPVELKLLTLKLLGEVSPNTRDLYWVNEPTAATDSQHITRLLYAAGKNSASPVFFQGRHKEELRYRYAQYSSGLETVARSIPEFLATADVRWALGEAVLSISNNVFDSERLAKRSAREILKYRESMEEARVKYVSRDLMEVTDLLAGNPWNRQTQAQLNNYVTRKLATDLALYDEQSRQIWEKMFGDLVVQSVNVAKSTVIGAGAGTLVGNVLPDIAALHLLLVGAAIAIAKESPPLVKTLVDAFIEFRKLKRSSIAYVAEFR